LEASVAGTPTAFKLGPIEGDFAGWAELFGGSAAAHEVAEEGTPLAVELGAGAIAGEAAETGLEAPGALECAFAAAGTDGGEQVAGAADAVELFEFGEDGRGALKLVAEFADAAFEGLGFLEGGPIEETVKEGEGVAAGGLDGFQDSPVAAPEGGEGVIGPGDGEGGGEAGAFGDVLAAGEVGGEEGEDAVELGGDGEEGIPGAGDGEVIAAGEENGDAAGVLREGGDALEFAGDEAFVENGEVEEIFGGIGLLEAEAGVIDIAAEDAPGAAALGFAAEVAGGGGGEGNAEGFEGPTVVAGGGKEGEGVIGRAADLSSAGEAGDEVVPWGGVLGAGVREGGGESGGAPGGEGSEAGAAEAVAEAGPDIGPGAEVFGGGPVEFEFAGGGGVDSVADGGEEGMGLGNGGFAEEEEEGAAAGVAGQERGQAAGGEEGAGDDFGEEGDPEGAVGKRRVGARSGEEAFNSAKLGVEEYL
jgi:hypothetical protein